MEIGKIILWRQLYVILYRGFNNNKPNHRCTSRVVEFKYVIAEN